MKNILIFASGSGTNAENIVRYFGGSDKVMVKALFCNNPKAGVFERMEKLHIPAHLFSREEFNDQQRFLPLLDVYKPDLIVLAGFLWLVPKYLISAYSGKIINIHPALLPKFGGKGMYGHHVHEAVLAKGEKEHGITIHFVDEKYDHGTPIFQAKFDIGPDAGLNEIQSAISALEMQYYPLAIEKVLGY